MSKPHFNLDQALFDWQAWPIKSTKKPKVVEAFSGGLTNSAYLITSGDAQFKLRINSPVSKQLGIDRSNEIAINNAVADLGLAPKIIYADQQHRYTVFEYIEGNVWSAKDLKKKVNQTKIAEAFFLYQNTNIDLAPRNYMAYLEDYESQIRDSDWKTGEKLEFIDFKQKLKLWERERSSFPLCHHDLIPENIVETESGICILDWEYAAKGCAELDLLSLACEELSFDLGGLNCSSLDSTIFELNEWLTTLWHKVKLRL